MSSKAFRDEVKIASLLDEVTPTQRGYHKYMFPKGVAAADVDYAIRILKRYIEKNYEHALRVETYRQSLEDGGDDEY